MKHIKVLTNGPFKEKLSKQLEKEINNLENKGYTFIDFKIITHTSSQTSAWIIYSD